ncbi:MAG: tripartite tricarboxylate transporter TctB family protein, partial [Gammaproteobacteria bacterium]|nr:tripartite tricarboxylate transporter TctB family protein [Gammaproteobacteria bacterium]
MSDRIFGCLVIVVALAFIASATQIQTSCLMDPVGPKLFPMLIGGVAVVCALGMLIKPDADPRWPA